MRDSFSGRHAGKGIPPGSARLLPGEAADPRGDRVL